MSKLDDILDPASQWGLNDITMKQQIKDLMLELTEPYYKQAYNRSDKDPVYIAMVELRKDIKEL